MTYLPSLIKKIDEFCRLSEDFRTIKRFAAPNPWDDPNFGMSGEESSDEEGVASTPYFDELVSVARQVDDPELSQQLEVLAELYRYSLQMGGGYSTIAKAINNLKNMYSDGSDSNIEGILNGMTKELAKAAGGINQLASKDNPSFVQRLSQLKQDIESRNQDGRSEALDAYQEEVSGQGQGAQSDESEEELAQAGLTSDQAEIINPAALGFGDKDDPKTNRGWHTVGSGNPYKNWKEYYENERLSYEADEANEHNEGVKTNLRRLIELLPVLSKKTEEALNLSNALKSDVVNPTEEDQIKKKLETLRQELHQLKNARQLLKSRIRSSQLQKEQEKLSEEEQSLTNRMQSSVDPERKEKARRELELLQQKKALNNLSISSDVLKANKRNYLLQMIRQMSGGNWPSQDWINKQQQKIDEAKTITKEDYDRGITEEVGRQQAREETPAYEAARGGSRIRMENLPPKQQVNLEKASFSALVYQFQIDIASAIQAARQAIYEIKTKGQAKKINPEYKKIIDEISEAIRNKDRLALSAAQKSLMTAVSNDLLVQKHQLKGYVEVIKLEPHFRKVLESIKEVTKKQKNVPPKLDASGNLITANFSDQDRTIFGQILNDIHRLRVLYIQYYTEVGSIKTQQHIVPRFKGVIVDMGRIETELALKLHVHRPEQKELYREKSPLAKEISKEQKKKWEEEWKRKTPQEKLEYEMKGKKIQDKWDEEARLRSTSMNLRFSLLKLAQDIKQGNEIDKTDADRLANEMFDTIYDQAYQAMLSELSA